MDMVTKGVVINIVGLGSTLLGIQALVGVLVAKTLANASANPFIASAAGVYNPVLALDVFLVQVGAAVPAMVRGSPLLAVHHEQQLRSKKQLKA